MSVGARILRLEDRRLLTGRARFVDDLDLPGAVHLALVRSPVPHALLRGIDVAAALELDGVVAVVTAADLAALGVGELAVNWISTGQRNRSNPALATDRVYYVGQPVAAVLAESRYLAEDAADLVELDLEELPAVTDAEAALADDAPVLHPDWGSNELVQASVEDGDVDEAFAGAAVTIDGHFRIHRQSAMPMETRAAVASFDPATEEVTLWTSTQTPNLVGTMVATSCRLPQHKLRVIAPDVGGGFGVKDHAYPEDLLVCVLAKRHGRPTKWVEDRREHFFSSVHSRQQIWRVELAADADGRVRGIRGRLLCDIGGHSSNHGIGPAHFAAEMLPGPYDIRAYKLEIVGVVTNKVPIGAYRGFGAPQGMFVVERLLEKLARQLGADPAELRLRNLIPSSAFPYQTVAMHTYDSGDYVAALERVLQLVDYKSVRAEQESAHRDGRHLGIAVSPFVMASGLAPTKLLGRIGVAYGNYESALVRLDPTGKATVITGATTQGQGVPTILAQACAAKLGLDPERDVTIVAGDTLVAPTSSAGAIASRLAVVAGPAVALAAGKVADKVRRIAARLLEASEADIELVGGRVHPRGSPAVGVDLAEIARIAYLGHDLPDEIEPGLEATHLFDSPSSSYPFGAHGVVVEVDPETGAFRILRYVALNDSGVMINPTIVEGQVVGGIVQGLAGAYLEELAYNESGQLQTTSFMDYLLPTAGEAPTIELECRETPAPNVPGGMKGAGETGIIPPAAVLANALVDALGIELDELPLSPSRLWERIRDSAPPLRSDAG